MCHFVGFSNIKLILRHGIGSFSARSLIRYTAIYKKWEILKAKMSTTSFKLVVDCYIHKATFSGLMQLVEVLLFSFATHGILSCAASIIFLKVIYASFSSYQDLLIREFSFHQLNANLLWPGSFAFAEWLIQHRQRMEGRRILELGR